MRSGVHNPIIPMGRSGGVDQGQFVTLNTSYLELTVAGATATLAPTGDLLALELLTGTGLGARTASSTWALRIITGTSNRLSVTNGDGVAGNPTLDIAATYAGQTSIATVGTISTGAWQGTVIATAYGGTGLSGTPTNGQLLIGNGTGYTLATIAAGTGVSVTNGAGTITIANTGVTSNVAGTGINVSGATGAVTITNAGVTSLVAGTNINVSGATGAVTVSLTGTVPTATTATNIAGGAAGSIVYQTGSGATSTLAIGSNGKVLTVVTGALSWETPTPGVTLTGTSNQIIVSAPSGAVTLSAPQDIHTGATPTFSGLNLTDLTLTGKVTFSSGTLSANGTTQGAGTTVTKDVNVVTSASSGSNEAVRLPTTAAGREVTIINATAVNVYVFPQSSSAISALGTNAAFTLPAGGCIKFLGTSTTQWYLLNTAYG